MSSASKVSGKIIAGEINHAFRDHFRSGVGRLVRFATRSDLYVALALTVRDSLLQSAVETTHLAPRKVAMAERAKQAASDLRASGKTMFAQ